MSKTKNIFGTLAAAFLPIMLFSFGVLFSAYQILGSPAPLKQALDSSGLYESVMGEALKNAGAEAGSTATGSLPVSDPGVQQAIKDAVPPDYIQQKSEGAIDGLYGWLQGDTDTLQFNVELEDAKTKLADGLASYTQQRVASLPVCTDTQDLTAATNPLNATCVPPNFDAATAGQTVKDEILNNQDFLPNSALSAQDLKNSEGQPLEQQLRAVPAVYEQVQWGAIITGVLAVLCTAVVLLMSGNIRRGLKRLGWIMLPVGLISALLAWGAGFMLTRVTEALINADGSSGLQTKILDALALLTQDIRNWWLGYGLTLAGIGIIALVVSFILKRRGVSPEVSALPAMATPGVAPLNPITNEEARHATEVAPTPSGAPERPGRGKVRKIQ